MKITKETVLRTTAMFDEGERPYVIVGSRTTLVVTRAVVEDVIGGSATIHLYGYRQEGHLPTYAGWHYPGNEPKHASYPLDRAPEGVRAIARSLEA